MFYLYGTGVLTACFAIATRESRNVALINYIQRVARTVHVVCSILTVSFHLYQILQTSSLKFLNVCRILYNLIITYMILYTETAVSCKLDEHINALLTNIQAEGKKQIRLVDLSLTLVNVTTAIQFFLFAFYKKTTQDVNSSYAMLMGKGSSPNYTIYYLGLMNFFYLIFSVVGAAHYYILVQYINYVYIKQVYREFSSNSPVVDRTYSIAGGERRPVNCLAQFDCSKPILSVYQWHMQTLVRLELIFLNKLRQQINESIGINAFSLMVPLWSGLVIGSSNILVNGRFFSNATLSSALMLNFHIWLHVSVLIAASNKCTDVIYSIRNLAKSLLLYMDSYGCLDCHLKDYLLLEPVEPLKMWQFIEIRSSLLLRVMNSVIPITLMITTSFQSYMF